MKKSLIFLSAIALAACGGGGDPVCTDIATSNGEAVGLVAGVFAPVAQVTYFPDGGPVTIRGSFSVTPENKSVIVRLYDNFASTQYQQEVSVLTLNGRAELPEFTWTPSSNSRTAVVYVMARNGGVVEEQRMIVEQCR